MFARKPGNAFAVGTANGSRGFVMPDRVAAVAAADGVIIWSAMKTPRGFAVVVDHAPQPFATFYTHLEKLLVTPTSRSQSQQRVHAGEPIGIVGFDPLDAAKLKHLHFELWHGGPKDAIDPAPVMQHWDVVPPVAVLLARRRAAPSSLRSTRHPAHRLPFHRSHLPSRRSVGCHPSNSWISPSLG